MIPPTVERTKSDPLGHRPPFTFLNNGGTLWRGTSRVLDKPARRKANRRTWKRMKADSRRFFVAHQKAGFPDA